MKTVGQLLSKARQEMGVSITELSRLTRIDSDYIQALEKDQYHRLPSATFVKGFIRNISTVLGKNPDDMVAVFRRDFKTTKTSFKAQPFSLSIKNKKTFLKPQLRPFVVLTLIFILYLGFQLRAYLIPPKLEIIQPKPGAIVSSPLTVEGLSDKNVIVEINQDTLLNLDSTNYFITTLSTSPGQIEVIIKVTNRFGRTTSKTIPLTVVSK